MTNSLETLLDRISRLDEDDDLLKLVMEMPGVILKLRNALDREKRLQYQLESMLLYIGCAPDTKPEITIRTCKVIAGRVLAIINTTAPECDHCGARVLTTIKKLGDEFHRVCGECAIK